MKHRNRETRFCSFTVDVQHPQHDTQGIPSHFAEVAFLKSGLSERGENIDSYSREVSQKNVVTTKTNRRGKMLEQQKMLL